VPGDGGLRLVRSGRDHPLAQIHRERLRHEFSLEPRARPRRIHDA
jgi:hypothetical protein